MAPNKALIFAKVPTGLPVAGKHITVETRSFDENAEAPQDGLITKQIYASFDPYMRGRMRAPGGKSYVPPFTLGQPITNRCVAKIFKSSNPQFQPGDVVVGMLNIEEYSVVPANIVKGLQKLENPYNLDPAVFLGALGMPGLTAYSSLYEIGAPKKGQTIFISAASGAVGQLVGQLAKHEGLKVIGSVGSDEKLAFIEKELGFDGGFNYKKEKPAEALKRLAPNGIDIYYENVGGEQLEAAIDALNDFGKIIACGMISQYNLPPSEQYGIKNIMTVVGKRLTIRGFIVGDPDFGPKWAKEHREKVSKWISEGSFKAQQSITEGIDNAPQGLLGLFKGENFGKAILKIADL